MRKLLLLGTSIVLVALVSACVTVPVAAPVEPEPEPEPVEVPIFVEPEGINSVTVYDGYAFPPAEPWGESSGWYLVDRIVVGSNHFNLIVQPASNRYVFVINRYVGAEPGSDIAFAGYFYFPEELFAVISQFASDVPAHRERVRIASNEYWRTGDRELFLESQQSLELSPPVVLPSMVSPVEPGAGSLPKWLDRYELSMVAVRNVMGYGLLLEFSAGRGPFPQFSLDLTGRVLDRFLSWFDEDFREQALASIANESDEVLDITGLVDLFAYDMDIPAPELIDNPTVLVAPDAQ